MIFKIEELFIDCGRKITEVEQMSSGPLPHYYYTSIAKIIQLNMDRHTQRGSIQNEVQNEGKPLRPQRTIFTYAQTDITYCYM